MQKKDQLSLFETVQEIYTTNPSLSQKELYAELESRGVDFSETKAISGKSVNLIKRKVRWIQQTLKQMGVLERIEDGHWRMTEKGNLHQAQDCAVLGFSTGLGIAIIADCHQFFSGFKENIDLVFTSPPYPLAIQRNYGNVSESEYVDWLCRTIEPVIHLLHDGASICLNVGNDIFLSKSPARSLYRERLVLALSDRFGLHKMDELIWHNPNKAPTPIQWASLQRVQLNSGYEPVYWFTNNPQKVKSNNQAVLMPHTEQHKKLIANGGNQTHRVSGDGSHVKKVGAYQNQTAGKIPRNVLSIPHDARSNKPWFDKLKEMGLPQHGALFPLALAEFFVRFLTKENDLVVDPFSGGFTTSLAAEKLNRRWVGTEQILEYVQGAKLRFAMKGC